MKVKNVIEQYFTNEFKTMSSHIPIDSSTIISNESLKEFNILRTSLIAEWYREIDETLKDYELYLDYDSIEFNGTSCEVNVAKGSDLIFEKSPEITQMSRNENHTILLSNNNEWKITKDIYTEEFESVPSFNSLVDSDELYNDELNKKVEILKEKKKNVKSEADKLKKEEISKKRS
ncbi:hypothetical protein H9637_16195 [Clostridium sp. N37]|uniref:Uncharacterized protein n=2 Tax=Clostridium TaxID=1485 RepID=A0ABR8YWE5_9CLOT|nr:hypothetical protein [Clostridium faecium]